MTLSLSPEKVGTWALREILRSAQMNKIASELVKALDGIGGGIYQLAGADLQLSTSAAKQFIMDLAAKLTSGHTLTVDDAIILIQGASGRLNLTAGAGINVFHGAALNLDGASGGAVLSAELGSLIDLFGLLKVEAGGQISVEPSGVLTIKGALNVIAGALLDVFGGITLDSGSLLDVLATSLGVNFDAGAGCVFHQAADLKISDVGSTNTGTWFSRMMPVQYGDISSAWLLLSSGAGSHGFEQVDVSVQRKLIFPVPLLPGDDLTSITARISVASQPGFSITKPVITLFRISSTGVRTDLASRTDPSASQGAYETAHDILLDATHIDTGTMPRTLNTQPMFLEFKGQMGADAQANALVFLNLQGTSVQRAFRVPIEVG